MNVYDNPFLILVYIYIVLAGSLFIYQNKFIFFPPRPDYLRYAKWKTFEISISSGSELLQGWRLTNHGCPNNRVLLYFGGNAEDVSWNLADANKYSAAVIYFVNLSGYGNSTGKSSQDVVYKNSIDIYDYIINAEHIAPDMLVIMGRSLGSAAAIYLNAHRQAAGLILVTPFYSILSLVPSAMKFFFPLKIMLRNKFENIKYIGNVKNTILVLAASHDEVIPEISTKKLVQAIRGKSEYVVIKDTNHQSITNDSYYLEINNYIKQL